MLLKAVVRFEDKYVIVPLHYKMSDMENWLACLPTRNKPVAIHSHLVSTTSPNYAPCAFPDRVIRWISTQLRWKISLASFSCNEFSITRVSGELPIVFKYITWQPHCLHNIILLLWVFNDHPNTYDMWYSLLQVFLLRLTGYLLLSCSISFLEKVFLRFCWLRSYRVIPRLKRYLPH